MLRVLYHSSHCRMPQNARASPVSFRDAGSERSLTLGRGTKRSADGDLLDTRDAGGVRVPAPSATLLETARRLSQLAMADVGGAGMAQHGAPSASLTQTMTVTGGFSSGQRLQ